MTMEIVNDQLRTTDAEIAGLTDPELVREVTEGGQILWLNSAPKVPLVNIKRESLEWDSES